MTGQVRVVLGVAVGLTALSLATITVRFSPVSPPAPAASRGVSPGPSTVSDPTATSAANAHDRGSSVGGIAGPDRPGAWAPVEGERPSRSGPAGNGPGSAGNGLAGGGTGWPTGPAVTAPAARGWHSSDGAGLPPLASQCPTAAPETLQVAPGSGRTIALTLDDGPGPLTRAVLDVLATERVHATFFVVGRAVEADPAAVARAAADGHLIGNHTWDHTYPRALRHGWTVGYLRDQLARTDAAVADATGRPTCFFRPPGGFTPPAVTVAGPQLRERVTLWSVDPRDWAVQGKHDPGPTETAAQADRIFAAAIAGRTQAHPVLLLHDAGGYRGATVAALPRIIAFYQELGYRFVRLDGRS
jgi:peptidoglycan/xylan/chitin deacetylase (PgdA/CDA1 family)